MDGLYEKLKEYRESDFYGFHMPGHKRNAAVTGAELPYGLDITEIEGFDDLHHAEGILQEEQRRAAELFHAQETHFLINGSTVGILSAILGCTRRKDKILMARNCHKSVYHAVYLQELDPVYVYPKYDREQELNGEIQAEEIKRCLEEEPEIRAVVLVSPTYDGVLSDICKIAEVVHEKKIPLIVDEAHGAHFGFSPYFPENSNVKGADIVIHSLHKTLPSLTQTALLHMNGTLLQRERIRKYLHMLQTSSPSYVLMASMCECIRTIREEKATLFSSYTRLLDQTRENLKTMQNLKLLESRDFDRSKIVVSVRGTCLEHQKMTGKRLYDILLKRYHLQMEMAAGSYVIAMTAPGDSARGMSRLETALHEIDAALSKDVRQEETGEPDYELPRLEKVFLSSQIENSDLEGCRVGWKDAAGKISMEYAYLYPPGIPIVVPGERISEKAAGLIKTYQAMGFTIEGTGVDNSVEVWINE